MPETGQALGCDMRLRAEDIVAGDTRASENSDYALLLDGQTVPGPPVEQQGWAIADGFEIVLA